MRNYYISNSNIIYTEREKTQSVWPGCQFELIGSFRSRREADDYCFQHGVYTCEGKRI